MKREFLKNLELTDEQIAQIMAENGKDVNTEIEKRRELETAQEELKKQLKGRDEDLSKLQAERGDATQMQARLSELEDKYKADKDAFGETIKALKLDAALDAAISTAKGRNSKAIKALIDMSKLELTDKGELKGLDIKALQQSDGYLFEQETQTDEGAGAAKSVSQTKDPQGLLDTTDTINKNWGLISEALANGQIMKG